MEIWRPGPLFVDAFHGLHVWRIALDDPALDCPDAHPLPPEERLVAERLVDAEQRRRFTASRIARRDILARYLGLPAETLSFAHSEYGKPRIGGRAAGRMHFNTSRSRSTALVVVHGTRDVGIDIEAFRSVEDITGIVDRYFAPAEGQRFTSLPESVRDRAFIRCWTRKEAFAKALGSGLSMELSRFTVSVSDAQVDHGLLAIDGDERAAARWTMRDIEVATGFAATVVVEEPEVELELFEWQGGAKR